MPRDAWRSLEPVHIVSTSARLERRIRERFPEASLARLAAEVHEVAREAAERTTAMRRPNWWVRVVVGLLVGALLVVVGAGLAGLRGGVALREWGPLAQTVESTINDLVFVGIAVVFLLSLERRLQRRRELRAIYELRSIAHIVDMHQLTKDPDRLRSGTRRHRVVARPAAGPHRAGPVPRLLQRTALADRQDRRHLRRGNR